MKAMILAAGQGTRLKPLTNTLPKPMVPVAGRPILEHIVCQIRDAGITDLLINLHYLPETIQKHFGDGSKFGVRIAYSVEPELLGTAGAVKKLQTHFTETFLVYYGDNYVEIDLRDFIHVHTRRRPVGSIAVFECEKPEMSGILQIDPEGYVLRFVEKPKPGMNVGKLANAGVYLLEPEVLVAIPEKGSSDFGTDIFPKLLDLKNRLRAYRLRGTVIGVDTPDLHARLETYLSKRKDSRV